MQQHATGILAPSINTAAPPLARLRNLADHWLPRLVLAPTLLLSLIFVYGFIAFTGYLSMTRSHIMPNYTFTGLNQ